MALKLCLFFLFIALNSVSFSQSKNIVAPFQLGEKITIVNNETFYVLGKKKPVFESEVPSGLKTDDLIFLFVGCSGGTPQVISKGWNKVVGIYPKKDPGDINVAVWYKVNKEGTPNSLKIKAGNKTFITVVTLRGIDPKNPIVDKAGGNNTAKEKGTAVSPSINGEKGGVTIAAFSFDDPYKVWVKDMYMLSSWKQGDDGQAIGIKLTNKNGQTGEFRTSKSPKENPKGGGHEAAATISLRAKK